MILRGTERVLVQGITGKQGAFWTERMVAYGTRVVGGVNPKKVGIIQNGLPVHGSACEAMRVTPFEVSVLFVPPLGVKDAALDAIAAGARKVVILTEHVPVQDVMVVLSAARAAEVQVLGPNTAGVVTPGKCFVGFMPAFNPRVFQPGAVGVISRSGSLGTLVCLGLVRAGLGISAFVGIGGDPVPGTTMREALVELDSDPRTVAIVVVGEIGGTMEEDAAKYLSRMTKPVAAFIAGAAAPRGKRMGHAGAIISGNKGTYDSKRSALEGAGAVMVDTPSQLANALEGRI